MHTGAADYVQSISEKEGAEKMPKLFFHLLEPYGEYLIKRYNKPSEVRRFLKLVAFLLAHLETQGGCDLEDLRPEHIYGCYEKVSDQNGFARAVRNFLRYAHQSNLVPIDYSGTVPFPRKHSSVPSVYDKEEIVQLLEGIARDEPGGKRAYAAILLVARLGLRSSDVCNLKFENIDFENKEISFIQVKTQKPNTLPLLPEVEAALLDYMENERPCSDVPFIFINRRTPPYKAMSISIIKHRLEKLFINTGVATGTRRKGPHALRASFASELLKEGVGYPAISKALGECVPSTVKHYVKIDVCQLRDCALEVPKPSGAFLKHLKGEQA